MVFYKKPIQEKVNFKIERTYLTTEFILSVVISTASIEEHIEEHEHLNI